MTHFSLIQRIVSMLVIITFMNLVFLSRIKPLYAQEQKEGSSIGKSDSSATAKITSETGFFSRKYFFEDEQLKSEKDFKGVLSRHPAALKEYMRSSPYAYISLIGTIGILVLTAKQFSETVKQANDPNFESQNEGWGDVTLLVVAGGVVVVSSVISQSYFKNAIRTFNDQQERNERLMKSSDEPDDSPGLEFGLYIKNDNFGGIGSDASNREFVAAGLLTHRF
ncbi:MAG TPA: hypothetical protein ACFYD0_14280 [Candidatus Wunengus sp. YC65]|uniref:hypothetical protein n=1 Tax=Candidatus Wunengus sp. YC65 TaxID=3367701 RepID=UPI004025F1F8